MLKTERTLLRPFTEGDAEDLYAYAKDPRVGPIAGWKPHGSVEESREIIRTVFTSPDTFAVVDRETGRVIGSAGFEAPPQKRLPVLLGDRLRPLPGLLGPGHHTGGGGGAAAVWV